MRPAIGLFALLLSAAAPPQRSAWTESRQLMSGTVTVTLVGATEEQAKRGFRTAFAQFERINEVMNEWRPDSPLSLVNRKAGDGELVPLPRDLCAVLNEGLAGAARVGGLFDPTWAALRGLWRFGTDQLEEVPTDAAIAAKCPLVSYRHVEIAPAAGGRCRVRLQKAGMQLGLGGLAKGHAVDQATQALRKIGLRDFLVQAGGDLYAAGRNAQGRKWRVGIRDPRGAADQVFTVLEVSDTAFSTSGDYEHFFLRDGNRYHHLIDPRSCRPALASRSASVLAQSALEAEILTKAVFIAGGDAGLALAHSNGAAAVIVTADNRVLISPALEGRLERVSPPTP